MERNWLELSSRVRGIGEQVVTCELACTGIIHNREILPRGLHLEGEGRTGRGVVIVGINPGEISNHERQFYRQHEPSFKALEDWLLNHGDYVYHRRLRAVAEALTFTGPILWTNLAKCQSDPPRTPAPLQTFRTCSGRYLQEEIALVPDWPLLGAGREPYIALAYRFPNRTVLGIPHPTGDRGGNFHRLMQHLERGLEISALEGQSVWLPQLLESSVNRR